MDSISQPSYGLEGRTFNFAINIRKALRQTSIKNIEPSDIIQAIRSSGSVGANFIEAKEALSQKDFLMRIKICRKEAEETRYWLRLFEASLSDKNNLLLKPLIQEALELTRIFGSIINKHK